MSTLTYTNSDYTAREADTGEPAQTLLAARL